MTDERRDRYAAAIEAKLRDTADALCYDPQDAAADAAMAVADAEQREANEKHQAFLQYADRVNNDLMKEVQRYAEGEEMPVLWSVYSGMHHRAVDAEAKNARLRAELEQLRTRARKPERAADLLAGSHRRAEQLEAVIARVEAYSHELRHKEAMGLLACLDTVPLCAECGHHRDQHSEADEPVSVGQCRQCAAEGNEDDAWHNYESQEQQ